ncbi:MAG: hypothetical protein NC489_38395, partial [Ruminococcus flavefaciens]|nr:hypothetical protein [Ruminococcus flavefaciens]
MDIPIGQVRMTDAELEEKIKELGGGSSGGGIDVLWTNPDSTKAFSGQTITLDKSLEGCRFCEVIYRGVTGGASFEISTGKISLDLDGGKTNYFIG